MKHIARLMDNFCFLCSHLRNWNELKSGACWGLTCSVVPEWHKAWFKARQPGQLLVLSGSCLSLIDCIGPGVLNTYWDWPRAECSQADGLLHSHNFSGSSQSPWSWVTVGLIWASLAGPGPSTHCYGPQSSGLFLGQIRAPWSLRLTVGSGPCPALWSPIEL